MGGYRSCVISIVVVSLLSACGLIDSNLTLRYKALETPVEVLKERFLLSVNIVDSREKKEVVGAHCGDMSYYLVRDSVADLVMDALSAEFVRRGYALGEGSVVVKIDLKEFFFSTCGRTHQARVSFEIQVFGKDGVSIYKNTIYGGATSRKTLWKGVSAEDTLEDALSNSMVRLFEDRPFQEAMVKGSLN